MLRKLTTASRRAAAPRHVTAVIALLTALTAGCGSLSGLTGLPSGVSENTPPAVTAVLPAAGAKAPADSAIAVTFNKPMSTGGLEISTDPAVALGPAQWSDDGRTATVRPTTPLAVGQTYTVRVRGRDRLGALMTADYVWSFTTVAPSELRGEGRLRLAELIDVTADARVFTLFAAILAAAPDDSGDQGTVRGAVRSRLKDLPARVVDPARAFFKDHPAPIDEPLASTLLLSGPPEFRTPANRPEAAIGPMLAQFHEGAAIADLWRTYAGAHAEARETYRNQVPAVLGQAADYMRATAVPAGRITVVPNLLGGPGQGYLVQQAGQTVFVVSAGRAVDRLALLRPFVRLALAPIRGTALEATQRAEPLYPPAREVAARSGYRTWPEIVAESMFEATAIRLALSGEDAQAALRTAYARGLVLVHHFTAQLADYERTTAALVDYYPTMVAAVDLDVELRRWAGRRPN